MSGQTWRLTSLIVESLSLYDGATLQRQPHNAGMDAGLTLDGFIALFTIPKSLPVVKLNVRVDTTQPLPQ